MWRVEEPRRADAQIDSIPADILTRHEKWKDIALISGPAGLRLIEGLHDEALIGGWKGYRSSRLGLPYRVIYRVVADEQVFQVVSITVRDDRRS